MKHVNDCVNPPFCQHIQSTIWDQIARRSETVTCLNLCRHCEILDRFVKCIDLPPALPLICGYLVNSACRSNLHGFLLFQNDLKLLFNAYTFNNVFHLILHKLCKLSSCCMPQTFLCRWNCHNDYVMYDVLNIYWLFVCMFNGIIQAVGYSCLELEHFNGYTLDLMLQ